jgi:hypothetical protein
LDAQTDLKLWTGILTGPAAWAVDLSISYAVVKWTCLTQREWIFPVFTVSALALCAAGAVIAWSALAASEGHARVRFMAILGLTANALFGLTIASNAIPHWVLSACQ